MTGALSIQLRWKIMFTGSVRASICIQVDVMAHSQKHVKSELKFSSIKLQSQIDMNT